MKKYLAGLFAIIVMALAFASTAQAWVPPTLATHAQHATSYAASGCASVARTGAPCVSYGINTVCGNIWKCGSWWASQPTAARHSVYWRNNYGGNYYTCHRIIQTTNTVGSSTWWISIIKDYGCNPIG